MKKVLPMQYPFIDSFNYYGSLVSILQDFENSLDWIYSNFIQLYYNNNWDVILYDFIEDYDFSKCPWISVNKVARDSANQSSSIIKFLIEQINSNDYAFFVIDRFYIPYGYAYQRIHVMHEIFVYGYDLEEECIYFADNIEYGKYTLGKCSFHLFELAYLNVTSDKFDGVFLISTKSSDYNFDIKIIRQSLIEYVTSSTDISKYKVTSGQLFGMDFNKFTFGIKVYEILLEQVNNSMSSLGNTDIRKHYLLWEHKKCMISRVQFLQKKGVFININDAEKILTNLDIIEYKLKKHYHAILKFRVTKNIEILKNIYADLLQIPELEKNTLEELISNIRNQ